MILALVSIGEEKKAKPGCNKGLMVTGMKKTPRL
jgi:hypothetical protein